VTVTAGVNLPGKGGTYRDNKSVDWIVLHTDASGNSLLMTDRVYLEPLYGQTPYHAGSYVSWG